MSPQTIAWMIDACVISDVVEPLLFDNGELNATVCSAARKAESECELFRDIFVYSSFTLDAGACEDGSWCQAPIWHQGYRKNIYAIRDFILNWYRCLTANLKALTDNLLLLSSRMSAEDVGFNCERSVQRVVKFPYLSTGRSIRHSPSRKVKV
eukprot:130090-Prorocentrum_minimum.AAC.2